jgi:DNA-binding NtrC family response regulator
MNVDLKTFTPAALQCLMGYAWPGNYRQFENEVKRLVAFVRGKSIKEEHLDPTIRNLDSPAPARQESKEPEPPPTPTLPEAIDSLEHRMIEDALRKSGGNKQKAAQALGLSRQGLIKKIELVGDLELKRQAVSNNIHSGLRQDFLSYLSCDSVTDARIT